MNNKHSLGKRQRETERAAKQRDKLAERQARRRNGPGEIEIVSASDMHGDLPSIEEAMAAIEQHGRVQRAAASIPVRLFVGGLSDEVTEHDLRAHFGPYGQVIDAVIVTDRGTRLSRGFGFVTMADRKEGARIIAELSGTELRGRNLVINVATDRAR